MVANGELSPWECSWDMTIAMGLTSDFLMILCSLAGFDLEIRRLFLLHGLSNLYTQQKSLA